MPDVASQPTPAVSVVVPVRDRRELLERLLVALDRQTWSDFEVIVVDDGSADGSGEQARSSCCRGRPVVVLDGERAGAVAARRLGVRHARGRVLAFTDSDCAPDPGWLAAGLAAIDAGADLVQGATVPARPPRRYEHTVSAAADSGLYPTCNVFYRRAAFDAAGGFDADAGRRYGFRHGASLRGLGFGEDTLLGWRVRRRGRAMFASEAVVRHHVFPPDLRDALRRAWAAGGFPALVREVPELRASMGLWGGFGLGGASRLPLYGAGLARATGRRRLAAVLAAAWVAAAARPVLRDPDPIDTRLRRVPAALALDAVTAAALVVGSARARCLVL